MSDADEDREVVWWSETGKRLHRDPNCPEFVRARRRALARMEAGDYGAATTINSYDFAGENIDQSIYPPGWMMPCNRCC